MQNDLRISSIDTLKFAAVISIVFFHGRPLYNISLPASLLVRQVLICAIPLFFLASGYLFRRKIIDGDDLSGRYLKTIKRLSLVFVAWSAIYFFVPGNSEMSNQIKQQGFLLGFKSMFSTKIQAMADRPFNFILGGTSMHLWFLVSLAMALTLLFLFIKFGYENKFLFVAVPLFIIQLLAGPYSITPLGIHLGTASYYGPFVSSLFVGIGALIATRNLRPSLSFAGWLILAGLIILFAERFLLYFFYGWVDRGTGYILGTVIFSIGLLLLALAAPSLGYRTGLARLGKYALGIYVVHVIFLPYGQKLHEILPKPLGEVSPLAVLAASLMLTIVILRLPYLCKIVT